MELGGTCLIASFDRFAKLAQLGDLRQVSQVTGASAWALQTGVTGYTTLLQFVVSQVTGSSAWT